MKSLGILPGIKVINTFQQYKLQDGILTDLPTFLRNH